MMTKRLLFVGFSLLAIVAGTGLLLAVPNPVGGKIISDAKAMGYLAYTSDEAVELAYRRCTSCHSEEKIVKYCSRCGPPFIVVSHFMKKYVEVINQANNGIYVENFSDAELITIIQVWNGLIGNWEDDWPQKDLRKLLAGNQPLIRLLETPVDQRPIEVKLMDQTAPGSYKEETNKNNPQG